MGKKLTISEAAATLGVSISTLRRWEREGRLVPERTAGGQRRYDFEALHGRGGSGQLLELAVDLLVAVREGRQDTVRALQARIGAIVELKAA
jgi:excisionase family DNA binding protein